MRNLAGKSGMVSNFAEVSAHQQAYGSNKPCEDTQKHFGVGWPRN